MFRSFSHNGIQIALVIKNNYKNDGVNFLTQNDSVQQVAYMNHPKKTVVKAHIHNVVERTVFGTPEVLIIKKGKLRLDLYSQEKEYIESTILESGDVVFLPYGGHGIKCLEDVEMIEVKQGPYLGEKDKVIFQEVKDDKVIIND